MNLQDSKVGNIGDILKHAALIALAGLIKKRNTQKKICYLDTHTYNFKSKCSNERWTEEVAKLVDAGNPQWQEPPCKT